MDLSNLSIGTYTLVYPNGEHRTIRVRMMRRYKEHGHFGERKCIGYLSGPNNEGDYTYFGHIDEKGELVFWYKFRQSQDPKRLTRITSALYRIAGDMINYGHLYAMKSGRCWRCNRLLTVPESIERGIGPECLTKISN